MPNGLVGALLGMGNPLLDISAVVDQAFLDKYGVRRRHGSFDCFYKLILTVFIYFLQSPFATRLAAFLDIFARK